MSERSEIERLGIELAKMVNGSGHGVIATTADQILALAAPEESPLKWPGCESEPEVLQHAVGPNWYVRHYSGSGWNVVGPVRRDRAAAIAEWNRVVRALAPTTPEGWREVVVEADNYAVIHDDLAWILLTKSGYTPGRDDGGWIMIDRKGGESDADLLARLNPPPGTPVIRVRRADK